MVHNSQQRKGKKYEEIYGVSRAEIIKAKQSSNCHHRGGLKLNISKEEWKNRIQKGTFIWAKGTEVWNKGKRKGDDPRLKGNSHRKSPEVRMMIKESVKKRHKEGFFNYLPWIQAGLKASRGRHSFFFGGCSFDSNQERQVAQMLISEGFVEKLVQGKNFQVRIGRKFIDFRLDNGTFLEYHPCLSSFGRDETREDYFERRRSLLDSFGFRNTLIVLTSISEVESFVKGEEKCLMC